MTDTRTATHPHHPGDELTSIAMGAEPARLDRSTHWTGESQVCTQRRPYSHTQSSDRRFHPHTRSSRTRANTRSRAARHGTAWHCKARQGTARQDKTRHDKTRVDTKTPRAPINLRAARRTSRATSTWPNSVCAASSSPAARSCSAHTKHHDDLHTHSPPQNTPPAMNMPRS